MKLAPGRTDSEAPTVGEALRIPGTYIYRGITKAFINTPTTFSEDDWVSITLAGLDGAFQVFFCVSRLIKPQDKSWGSVDHFVRGPRDPFIRYAFKGLGPTFSGQLALPALDIDRNSELPVASLRFLRFSPERNGMQSVDIPFASLITENRTDIKTPQAERDDYSAGVPPYVVSWDGLDNLCVLYCDGRPVNPEDRKLPRG
ncbi:hypothetical protein B0H19DRAFT_1249052 [Mycena capillaripes]|nr:hypothetical protein B0H19DRAFT_1249052 [Mycena capillaripes]